MKYIVTVLLILNCFLFKDKIFSEHLSEREKKALKLFINTLVEESECGYVLFNIKPVCIHGYECEDSFVVNTSFHKEMIALKEGAKIWNKLPKNKNSEIIIHISQNKDKQFPNVYHLLAINVPLFHQVVNENLSLFQYVLGSSVTSKSLLMELVDNDQPFQESLKYDKVLIGILLGFETQNSLLISRIENMEECEVKEIPPFLPSNMLRKKFNSEYLPLEPSFGFKNFDEEKIFHLKKTAVSSKKLQDEKPNFIFGYDKTISLNKKLIEDLETAQKMIQDLVKNENYEELVLNKITGGSYSLKNKESIVSFNAENIDLIVAKGLFIALKNENPEYINDFIEGLSNRNNEAVKIERNFHEFNLNDFIKARKNLNDANEYFKYLATSNDYKCIEPLKLYCKIIESNRNTKNVVVGNLVDLTYTIFSPKGHCLEYQKDEIINLDNTIAGFDLGIREMKEGETQEIFIHPSLAYGFDAKSIDKCIYIRAIVTLNKVLNHSSFIKRDALNLDFIIDQEELHSRQNKYKNYLKSKGKIISSHLSKSKIINLEKVVEYLKLFQKSGEDVFTTSLEQDLINQLHWDIYYN